MRGLIYINIFKAYSTRSASNSRAQRWLIGQGLLHLIDLIAVRILATVLRGRYQTGLRSPLFSFKKALLY